MTFGNRESFEECLWKANSEERARVVRKLTSEQTFEEEEKCAWTRVWWQIDILKSRHAAKFTVWKHYTADFWELVAEGVIRRFFRRHREILKYQRAAKCTMWKHCRADFWECVAEEVIRSVFRRQLAVWWSGIGAGSAPAKYHGEILQVLRVEGVRTLDRFSLLSCVHRFLTPYLLLMYMPLTLHHAKWESPRNALCFLVWMNFSHFTTVWNTYLSHPTPRKMRIRRQREFLRDSHFPRNSLCSEKFSLLSRVDEFLTLTYLSHFTYVWNTYLSHPTPHKIRMIEQFFLLSSIDEFLTPYMLLTYTPLTPYTAHTPCVHLTCIALTPYYRTSG